jgi:hypothetical protein
MLGKLSRVVNRKNYKNKAFSLSGCHAIYTGEYLPNFLKLISAYFFRNNSLGILDTEDQWRTEGGWGFQPPPPPRNSEVLPKLSRIPSSVEYFSITT